MDLENFLADAFLILQFVLVLCILDQWTQTKYLRLWTTPLIQSTPSSLMDTSGTTSLVYSQPAAESVCTYTSIVVCQYSRDHAADVLFEDDSDDPPLPVCILEALLRVPLVEYVTCPTASTLIHQGMNEYR